MTAESESYMDALQQYAEQAEQQQASGRTSTRRAGDLTSDCLGMEVLLPGYLDENLHWVDTWSQITMISHTKSGVTKIRRHPDHHGDHTLQFNDQIQTR